MKNEKKLKQEKEEKKKCTICKKKQPLINFHKDKGKKDGLHYICKICQKKVSKEFYFREKDGVLKRQKIKRQANFFKILEYYGKMCACCGEDNPLFLTIDHINGDGNKHRKKIKRKGGSSFYNWLIKNNFPNGFQILCFNCNLGQSRNNNVCPHRIEW